MPAYTKKEFTRRFWIAFAVYAFGFCLSAFSILWNRYDGTEIIGAALMLLGAIAMNRLYFFMCEKCRTHSTEDDD